MLMLKDNNNKKQQQLLFVVVSLHEPYACDKLWLSFVWLLRGSMWYWYSVRW